MSREPRWQRLEPGARRAQILQAAQEAFSGAAYDEVSLTAIARAAGVSRTLVTHYFGGKRQLFLAVQRRVLELGESAIAREHDTPIELTVERNVSAWLDFASTHREMALRLNLLASGDHEPERVAQTRERLVDTMLVDHFGTTDVPAGVRLVMRSFTGLAQVAIAEWLAHGRATRAQVQTLMIRGLLALVRDAAPAVVEAGAERDRRAREPR